MSRLRFSVGELAIVITNADWDDESRRELGSSCECEIVEINHINKEGDRHDYLISVQSGAEYMCFDAELRKRPSDFRGTPRVESLNDAWQVPTRANKVRRLVESMEEA